MELYLHVAQQQGLKLISTSLTSALPLSRNQARPWTVAGCMLWSHTRTWLGDHSLCWSLPLDLCAAVVMEVCLSCQVACDIRWSWSMLKAGISHLCAAIVMKPGLSCRLHATCDGPGWHWWLALGYRCAAVVQGLPLATVVCCTMWYSYCTLLHRYLRWSLLAPDCDSLNCMLLLWDHSCQIKWTCRCGTALTRSEAHGRRWLWISNNFCMAAGNWQEKLAADGTAIQMAECLWCRWLNCKEVEDGFVVR